MYYFGYYIQFGCPCSVKWTGEKSGPGEGGRVNEIVQVHEVTSVQFRWPLSHLASWFPFKELPELQ